jgi:hypothetical protein
VNRLLGLSERAKLTAKQCAFHKLATVKAGENYFASKIEMLGLKAFAPSDALFRWPIRAHFLAFSLSSPTLCGFAQLFCIGTGAFKAAKPTFGHSI